MLFGKKKKEESVQNVEEIMPETKRSAAVKSATNSYLKLGCAKLLKLLQVVSGVIEKRQTMPILANVLLVVDGDELTVTATDSEIELVSKAKLGEEEEANNFGATTFSGRKLMDICRSLPEKSMLEISCDLKSGRATLTSDHSRFVLATLPAQDLPLIPVQQNAVEIYMKCGILKTLAGKVYFAIPQNDPRAYLNGMFLEIKGGTIKTAAGSGGRLALGTAHFSDRDDSFAQVIVPRKAVAEIIRLFSGVSGSDDDEVLVGLNSNYIKISGRNFIFTSKLVAGKYPNYNSLVPKDGDKNITISSNLLKQALQRINILSHEILREFRFNVECGVMRLVSSNPDQEEAIEELAIDYDGEKLDVSLNIGYILDILSSVDTDSVVITLKDSKSALVIKSLAVNYDALYVLMPIRARG